MSYSTEKIDEEEQEDYGNLFAFPIIHILPETISRRTGTLGKRPTKLLQLGLAKQKIEPVRTLEKYLTGSQQVPSYSYFSETTVNDWICNVHFMTELEGWRVIRFDNSTTVAQALEKLTKMLNSLLDNDNDYENYVITVLKEPVPSTGPMQIVPLGPPEKVLKTFFPSVPGTQVSLKIRNDSLEIVRFEFCE
jgi:hypothetical protein